MKKNLYILICLLQVSASNASAPKCDSSNADSKKDKEFEKITTTLSAISHSNGDVSKQCETENQYGLKLTQIIAINKNGSCSFQHSSFNSGSKEAFEKYVGIQAVHREALVIRFLGDMQKHVCEGVNLVESYKKFQAIVADVYSHSKTK